MTQLFPCCTVSAAISECLGYSQISCYSFRFCGIMRTKLRKYLVNHFIILKDCSWTLLFLPDDMNNWLLTSLNQIGTIYSKYILKICEDVGPILQKQSLTNSRLFHNFLYWYSANCIYFSKCPTIIFSKHIFKNDVSIKKPCRMGTRDFVCT